MENEKLVFIESQIVCAKIRLEAMKARNKQAEFNNEAQYYTEDDFMRIIDEYQIGYNDVFGRLYKE